MGALRWTVPLSVTGHYRNRVTAGHDERHPASWTPRYHVGILVSHGHMMCGRCIFVFVLMFIFCFAWAGVVVHHRCTIHSTESALVLSTMWTTTTTCVLVEDLLVF